MTRGPRRVRGAWESGRAYLVALWFSALAAAASACGGGPAVTRAAKAPSGPATSVRVAKDRPPVSVIVRAGDARGAIAVAVATGGIADELGATASVALAGAMEARLAAAGIAFTVVPGWDGWRARALVADAAEATRATAALRDAMLAPIAPGDAIALAGAQKKVDALAARPMADVALADAVRCTGEPFSRPGGQSTTVRAEDLEAWRRAAHGLDRVAFATAGEAILADAAASALAGGSSWPTSTPVPPLPLPAADARAVVYDATGTLPAGSARITLAAHAPHAAKLLAAAFTLGDPRGPLASRLGALDAPAKVKTVTAAAHPSEGCLAVTVDLEARDLATDVSGRIATAATLARQELAVDLDSRSSEGPRALAIGASDPRDAAERAAWWALTGQRGSLRDGELRVSIAVGVADGRDQGTPASAPRKAGTARDEAILRDIDRATLAWHAPVVESRTRVEAGQGELWLLLASPCGTSAEDDDDAGLGAAVAVAAAQEARRAAEFSTTLATVEPFVDGGALGLLVHGPPLDGESPAAQARRLADVAARSFAADPLEARAAGDARGLLLAKDSQHDGRVLAGLADALAPGHASWLAPFGTADGLSHASDAAVVARAAALRAGPLRVAVLASEGQAQADAAVRAVDRWIARRPGEARACAVSDALAPRLVPGPGTYAVETFGADDEAWIAAPLPAADANARREAEWLAAALDGETGLLSGALGGEARAASSWSARVVGGSRAPALAVRVVAPAASLDAAVASVRALLGRLAGGALDAADYDRARAALAQRALTLGLDPRARIAALFLSPSPPVPPPAAPTLASLRAFAASALEGSALVIVAARPPRDAGDSGARTR